MSLFHIFRRFCDVAERASFASLTMRLLAHFVSFEIRRISKHLPGSAADTSIEAPESILRLDFSSFVHLY